MKDALKIVGAPDDENSAGTSFESKMSYKESKKKKAFLQSQRIANIKDRKQVTDEEQEE